MLRRSLLVAALASCLCAAGCKAGLSQSEEGGTGPGGSGGLAGAGGSAGSGGAEGGSGGAGSGGSVGEGGSGGAAGAGELPDPSGAWIQTRGPTGFSAERLLVLPNGTILAVSYDAILRSTDGGASWSPSEGIVGNGDRRSVVAAGDLLLLEDRGLGLWRSVDFGGSWERVAGWGQRSSFVVDGAGVVFAIAKEGQGFVLVKSEDRGATWSEVGPVPIEHAPLGQALFAAAGKLFVFDPYGATRLSRSDDGGLQWVQVEGGVAGAVVGFGDSIFVSAGRSIGRSTDGGVTWSVETVPGGVPEGYTFELLASDEALFRRTYDAVLRWNVESQGWDRVADESPAVLIGCGAAGTTLLCADREELYRLDGEGWSGVATSYVGTEVQGLSGTEQRLFARTAQGRVFSSTDAGASWNRVALDGDFFTPVDFGAWVAAGPPGTIYRSGDGVTWEEAYDFLEDYDRVEAFFPLGDSLILALASGKLIRSVDNGFRWKDFRDGLPQVGTDSDGFARFPPLYEMADLGDVLLARSSSYYGTLRSADGGKSWAFVTAGLPEGTDLAHFARSSDAIVAVAGAVDGPQLYRSFDDGESWEPAESNLPAGMAVFELFPSGDSLIALLRPMEASGEGETGAWASVDGGTSWTFLADELPKLPTDLLEAGGHLYAGTVGAGVWRLRLE